MIEKIVRLFHEVELSDMPALVYQLLLLSTKVCCYIGRLIVRLLREMELSDMPVLVYQLPFHKGMVLYW